MAEQQKKDQDGRARLSERGPRAIPRKFRLRAIAGYSSVHFSPSAPPSAALHDNGNPDEDVRVAGPEEHQSELASIEHTTKPATRF